MKPNLFRILLPLQLALVTCGVVGLAFAPPARGQFLLLPLLPGSDVRLAADALDRGARLIAVGPVRGSIIVSGDRDAIAKGMLARGVLTLAAPDFICGKSLAVPGR